MRNLLFLLGLALITPSIGAQEKDTLVANTPFYEAINKWVAFPGNPADSAYIYGFIYLDGQAGFTFYIESIFNVRNGQWVAQPKNETSSVRHRVNAETRPVIVLTPEQIKRLNLPERPKWWSMYQLHEPGSVAQLTNTGYHLNAVGLSQPALEPLEKAYGMDPNFDQLAFELGFAYNATGRYDKAAEVLLRAIEHHPEQASLYKELGFAYKQMNRLDEAEAVYRKGVGKTEDDNIKAEMAVNMAQAYFLVRDKKKFKKWAELTRQYSTKSASYAQYIDLFEQEWDKTEE